MKNKAYYLKDPAFVKSQEMDDLIDANPWVDVYHEVKDLVEDPVENWIIPVVQSQIREELR